MSKEYIERGALIDWLDKVDGIIADGTVEAPTLYKQVITDIAQFPAADVKEVKHGRCKFCGGQDNAFHILNAETAAYSGIELAINRQGMLRVRVYDDYECETALPQSSEIIMIYACPNCGAKMDLKD